MKAITPHSRARYFHISCDQARGRGGYGPRRLVYLLAVLVALAGASASALPATRADARVTGYPWPVKPFDRPHPVRGNFGDPRTSFSTLPTVRGLMTGSGDFFWHVGVDIAVPDGTAVYAVESGVASIQGTTETRHVHVDHGAGFATDYWHIVIAIANGQHVTAGVTPLGRVMKGYEHVHLTELRNGVAVNPLASGHLTPYVDRTRPVVAEITFRAPSGEELLPEYVHGSVDLLVQAADSPAMRVPGRWSDLPVAPAFLSWRLERADRTRVLPERVAFDVRSTLPPSQAFWRVYARGTRQNMTSFHGQRAWRLPGVYLYRLTRDAFDTRRLPTGIYRLVVTARDTRDNTGSAAQMLIIRNNPNL